jgi:hypothetical protein
MVKKWLERFLEILSTNKSQVYNQNITTFGIEAD